MFTFLFLYANEESDDIINCSSKTVKYQIKNISRNIRMVLFKLGNQEMYITKETNLCAPSCQPVE